MVSALLDPLRALRNFEPLWPCLFVINNVQLLPGTGPAHLLSCRLLLRLLEREGHEAVQGLCLQR